MGRQKLGNPGAQRNNNRKRDQKVSEELVEWTTSQKKKNEPSNPAD
ncbi:hypothetical protein [Bacillus sp. B15-48]|nr:hypothetical protein [Bacillus sp. B15-48]